MALTAQVVNEMKIVIRIHSLPVDSQNSETFAAIGANFGQFLSTLKNGGGVPNQFFRIKVLVEVTKQLKRGFFAMDECGTKTWYRVSYERLPMFCFLCGTLGHGEAQCPTRYEDDFIEPDTGFPFGNWMRANGDSPPDMGNPVPLQPLALPRNLNIRTITERKRGEEVFGVGNENSLNSGECNSISASNYFVGERRRIDSVKLKRKQKCSTSPHQNRSTRPKQHTLSLRDEEAQPPPNPMSCLFWNCQGLGTTLTIPILGDLIREKRPDVLFLCETKGTAHDIASLKRKWNLHGIAVDRVGQAGGLALL